MVFSRAAAARRALRKAQRAGNVTAVREAWAALAVAEPGDAAVWFDRGLLAKRERDWALARECNARALELEGDGTENPSAWNLGIAATALGDWDTARRAWAAYGVGLEPGTGPIEAVLGSVPVRLNPEPRHPAETPLLLDGQEHATEVVWVDRMSPAHGRILNVPTPASGHRFGDVVLHDGVPVGERRSGDRLVPVFDELAVLTRSHVPTFEVDLEGAGDSDVEELLRAFDGPETAATEWATSVRMLCRACSEGAPVDDAAHDHDPRPPGAAVRTVAVAAPSGVVDARLAAWVAAAPGRRHALPLQVA